jgi:hypothetical protein
MLKRFTKCILLFLAVLLIKTTAWAQSPVDSSSNYQINPAYANIVTDFYKKIGSESRLYNGILYDFYDPTIIDNAYFENVNTWSKGSVIYDGYVYNNASLLYDLYTDQLVMLFYNKFLKIALITEKIRSFDLLDHHFIYLKNDPSNPNSLNTGFYANLYEGKIKVFARYSKSIQHSSNISGTITSTFTPNTDYYIFKDGKYYKTNGQGSFLDVLKNHKKEIKQFLKNNKIIFKTSPELSMTAIAAYYDSLTD